MKLYMDRPLFLLLELLRHHRFSRLLKWLNQGLLTVPPSYFRVRGETAFETAVLKLWKSLLQPVRPAKSVICFKRLLKTNFYRLSFP